MIRWLLLLAAALLSACDLSSDHGASAHAAAAPPPITAATPPPEAPEPTPAPRPFAGETRRLAALGSLTSLSPRDLALLAPGDFEPLPAPKPGEWLSEHGEAGQSYDDFVDGRFVAPSKERRVLYLLPLGYPGSPDDPPLSELLAFARAYFGVEARALPRVSVAELGDVGSRQRRTGRQLRVPDILEALRRRLPDDAFLLAAITAEDLYPDASWNFVFGQATLRKRVGVFSTARYHPAFYGSSAAGRAVKQVIRRRTLDLMAHEIGHMFGLEHCIYYRCAMNGSNGLAESDRAPLHLCPVCLRKLRHGARFDIAARYRRLERLYRRFGMAAEARWIHTRLGELPARIHRRRGKARK